MPSPLDTYKEEARRVIHPLVNDFNCELQADVESRLDKVIARAYEAGGEEQKAKDIKTVIAHDYHESKCGLCIEAIIRELRSLDTPEHDDKFCAKVNGKHTSECFCRCHQSEPSTN